MPTGDNKVIVRRFFEQFESKGDRAALEEMMAPDYTHHDASLPPDLQHGREAYGRLRDMFVAAFPNMRLAVTQLIGEGDKVTATWRCTGTHQGELMGIPPTGKHVDFTGSQILRLSDGKIVEGWVVFDVFRMMQQLGVVPETSTQQQAA